MTREELKKLTWKEILERYGPKEKEKTNGQIDDEQGFPLGHPRRRRG